MAFIRKFLTDKAFIGGPAFNGSLTVTPKPKAMFVNRINVDLDMNLNLN